MLNILRPPLCSLRPLVSSETLSATARASAIRRIPTNVARSFSNTSPTLQLLQKRLPTPQFALRTMSKGSRSIMTDREIIQQKSFDWRRFGITAATVAGVVVGLDALFNREQRDTLSPAERSLLNDTFKYTGTGLALTALAARQLFTSGYAFRIMAANPWVVLGISLVGSIGTMMGTFYTPPDKSFQKHLFWLGFNACQAATLSPLFFLNPALLTRAALYTVGVVGAISYVGATATNDKYLALGGPLLAGVTVVALSSLAPMVLPMGMRALAISESISLYGGLAVFGGFILFDTQKILQHARLAEQGQMKVDPVNESISLELDMINIFIRIVQILTMQQRKK